jgi:hypothetical protein
MIPDLMMLAWEVTRRRPEAIEDFRIPEPIPKPRSQPVSWSERLCSLLTPEPSRAGVRAPSRRHGLPSL